MIIKLNIDVTKLDKARLHKGAKGTYANLTVLLRDQTDQYGNDGMIVEDVSKDERLAGNKGTIVGNAKIIGKTQEMQPPPNQRGIVVTGADDEDDCPF